MKVKPLILILFLSCYFFNCETAYLNNRYEIIDVNVRLVDFVGLDSAQCAIYQKFNCLANNEFSGIGIKIYKKFVTDSTRHKPLIGYYPIGKSGRNDSIEVFQIRTNRGDELDTYFFGNDSKSYISPQESYYSDYINGYICSPKSCKCIGVPIFDSTELFVNAYNSNRRDIIGELLEEEFYFWINKNELKKLVDENLILVIGTNRKKWEISLGLSC